MTDLTQLLIMLSKSNEAFAKSKVPHNEKQWMIKVKNITFIFKEDESFDYVI